MDLESSFEVKVRKIFEHQVFRNGSRPGDFSPRETVNNEAKERRTATTHSPQLTLFALRVYSESHSRCMRVSMALQRASCLSHAKRNVKSVTFVLSLSQKQRARSRCLFFSPPRTSRPGGSWRMRAIIAAVRFYRPEHAAKGLEDAFTARN